jgi:hypothetical protein
MGRTKRILMAAAAVTAVAAAGSAFTAGITGFPADRITGYGATDVSGGTVTNVAYAYDTEDSSKITGVTVTFAGDLDGAQTTAGASSTEYTFGATWSSGVGGTVVISTVGTNSTVTAKVGVWTDGTPSDPTTGTTAVLFTPTSPVSAEALTKFSVLVSEGL